MSKGKKESYYFSHDCGACRDVKILKLRQKYEWKGYGIFWAIIEALRETSNNSIQLDMVDALLYDLRIDREIFDYMFECGLLVKNETCFYSPSLLKRMKIKDEISEKRRESGRMGGKHSKKYEPEIEPPRIPPTDGNTEGATNINEWADAVGKLQLSQIEIAIVGKLVGAKCTPEDAKKARLANLDYFGKITGDNAQRLIMNQRDMRLNGIEKPRQKTDEEIFRENMLADVRKYAGIPECKK